MKDLHIMSTTPTPALEALSWQEARASILSVNPDLAAAIDTVDPPKEYKLYRVKYPFGADIVKNGVFHLPTTDGRLLPIRNSGFPDELVNQLSYYNGVPTSIVLKNSAELYVGGGAQAIPFGMLQEGRIFGLWRVLDSFTRTWHIEHIWSISAGARSLLMLPKITDSIGYMRLKKEFGIKSPIPKKLTEQWPVFKELANNSEEDWNVEFLLFPRQWFETSAKDNNWVHFKYYLLQTAWQGTEYWRNQSTFEFVFSCMQRGQNLKPNPYLADTVKHLIAISSGAAPGFVIADDESAAPIRYLQKVFMDIYGLKSYAPLMMHLKHMFYHDTKQLYYSLQYPTTLEFSPKSRSLSSNMVDLHEIRYIIDKYLDAVLDGSLPLENASFKYFAEHVKFHYYHTEKDTHGDVDTSEQILQRNGLMQAEMARFKGRALPESAPFFRGCISLDFEE